MTKHHNLQTSMYHTRPTIDRLSEFNQTNDLFFVDGFVHFVDCEKEVNDCEKDGKILIFTGEENKVHDQLVSLCIATLKFNSTK